MDTDTQDHPLSFQFRLKDHVGILSVEHARFFGWLGIAHLEFEVPNIRTPLAGNSPQQFQRRRTRLRTAVLDLPESDLAAFLALRAPALGAAGFDRVQIECRDGHLTLAARVREAGELAEFSTRLRLSTEAHRLRLAADRPLVFGAIATPAPVVAHRILCLLASIDSPPKNTEPMCSIRGLAVIEIDPIAAFAWHTFPAAGWRLPNVRTAQFAVAECCRSGVHLHMAEDAGGSPADRDTSRLFAALGRYRDADNLLLRGDIEGATCGYRTGLQSQGGAAEFLFERLLATTSSDPHYFAEGIELAREALARWPDFPAAHAAMASIRLAQQDPLASAERYRKLIDTPLIAAEPQIVVRAAIIGARLSRDKSPKLARHFFERIIDHVPGHPEASDALFTAYQGEAQWNPLVKLLRSRIATSTNAMRIARDHRELARILADELGDTESACDELLAACNLTPDNARSREELAEILIRIGKRDDAVRSLRAAARCHADLSDRLGQTRALLRAADLLLADESPTKAKELYDEILADSHSDQAALTGAARCLATLGEHSAAAELWQRLVDTAVDIPIVIAEYSVELGEALSESGDHTAALDKLEWAASRAAPPVRARAHDLISKLRSMRGEWNAAIKSITQAIDSLAGPLAAPPSDDETRALRTWASELRIRRAEIFDGVGRAQDAVRDYEEAFDLAGTSEDLRIRIGRALKHAAFRIDDHAAQLRWTSMLLASPIEANEKSALFLERAELATATGEFDRRAVLSDIEAALSEDVGSTLKARALELKAQIFEGAEDPLSCAHALTEKYELAHGSEERMSSAIGAAEAWILAGRDSEGIKLARIAVDLANDGDTAPVTRRRAFIALGESAWRKRQWADVILAYAPLCGSENIDDTARLAHRLGIAYDESGDKNHAAEAFEWVARDDNCPRDLRANSWRLLAGVRERLDQFDLAAQAFESFAADERAALSDSSRADAWYRAGALYGRLDSRIEDAERCLESALHITSGHLPALDALESINREAENYERVAVILGRKIAATRGHPGRQRSLLARLADLQHLRLGRTDVARETYQRALELDPDFRLALRFLLTDARESNDVESAARSLSRLARDLDGDHDLADSLASLTNERIEAAAQLAKLATSTPESLEYAPLAMAALETNSTSENVDDRVLEGIEMVQRARGDWRAVAATLGRRAAGPTAGARALPWDLERIDILAGTLGDNSAAHTAAHAALARNPGDASLKSFASALQREIDRGGSQAPHHGEVNPDTLRSEADQAFYDGNYGRCAECLEELVRHHSVAKDDGGPRPFGSRSSRGELFLRLADLYYDHLTDVPRAREAMRRAAEAFGRGARRDGILRLLATETAATCDFAQLASALEAIDDDRLTSSDRLGLAKAYRALGRSQQAIEVLQRGDQRGALSEESASLLLVLYRDRQQKSDLAHNLAAGASESPPDVAETRLREALKLFDTALIDAESSMRVKTQLAELESPAPHREPRATELRRAAEAAEHDGDLAVAAVLLARAVVEQAENLDTPDPAPVLSNLDKLRRVAFAASPADPTTLGGAPHFQSLVSALEATAKIVAPARASSLIREAASVSKNRLHDPRAAASLLGRLAALHPGDPQIFDDLCDALRATGDNLQLAEAYEQHTAHVEGPVRAQALIELARLVRSAFKDRERALELFAEARAIDPGLGSSASAEFDESLTTSETRMDSDLAAASEHEVAGHLEQAVFSYRQLIDENPGDRRALAALERIFKKSGNDESLANVLEILVERTVDLTARGVLCFRLCNLYRRVPEHESEAYRVLKQAHACEPDNATYANTLRMMAMARGEWPLAAELLYREIEAAPNSRERAALHLELALIYDEKLFDARQAICNYQAAIDLDPSIPAAPAPLGRLYELEGQPMDAANAYAIAAQVASRPEVSAEHMRKAGQCAEAAGDVDLAHRHYRNAAYLGAGETKESAEASLAKLGGTENPRTNELLAKLSNVPSASERLAISRELLTIASDAGNDTSVVAYAQQVLDLDGADTRAYLELKQRLDPKQDLDALVSLIGRRAHALANPKEKGALYYQIGRMYQYDKGDGSAAQLAYQKALEADSMHLAALEELAQLCYLRSDWERARSLFARLSPEQCSLPAAVLAFRRGEIAEMLGLYEEAGRAFAKAVEHSPVSRPALDALIRSAVRSGQLEDAIDAARKKLDLIGSEEGTALIEAHMTLAELCDANNDIDRAIYYYELVICDDTGSRRALEALTALYSAKGDTRGAIRSLRALIEVLPTRGERADRHYQIAELLRANVKDHDAAAKEYLAANDLDSDHLPTARRLLDFYWSTGDGSAVLHIAWQLLERDGLIGIETPTKTLARVMLIGALMEHPIATRIAESLPGDINFLVAETLLEARTHGPRAETAPLVSAVFWLDAQSRSVSAKSVGESLRGTLREVDGADTIAIAFAAQ